MRGPLPADDDDDGGAGDGKYAKLARPHKRMGIGDTMGREAGWMDDMSYTICSNELHTHPPSLPTGYGPSNCSARGFNQYYCTMHPILYILHLLYACTVSSAWLTDIANMRFCITQ